MKYSIRTTTQFRKDYKLMKKRGYNMKDLEDILEMLVSGRRFRYKNGIMN